ncbi:rCG37086 [Rattus norvegicus]|uniref:RCG37086 n=1 Tax=Rattus norvegicus TaxID=10116 RepID=A6HTN7_RAT|nr:rCG37086 [Rattus norvegicus]
MKWRPIPREKPMPDTANYIWLFLQPGA